jgi:hypothetical protein
VDSEYSCFECPKKVDGIMKWQGKDLEEYGKGELIVIIEALYRITEQQARRHVQELESLIHPEDD